VIVNLAGGHLRTSSLTLIDSVTQWKASNLKKRLTGA